LSQALGGSGVGGNGGGWNYTATPGINGTGSGGGGGGGNGAAGGSGIVIIRYPDPSIGIWSSNNDGIISVNNDGLLTAHSSGAATINYTVTSPIGCVGNQSHAVSAKSLPAIPVVINDSPVCEDIPVNVQAKGFAPGGKVVQLSGTNSISSASLSSTSNDFTIEFWAKPNRTRLSTIEMNGNNSIIPNLGDNEQSLAIHPDNRGADAGAGVSVGNNGIS